jgi:hypothetical protein
MISRSIFANVSAKSINPFYVVFVLVLTPFYLHCIRKGSCWRETQPDQWWWFGVSCQRSWVRFSHKAG